MKNKLFSPARKEAGFTLIELLTVIVIIGILAAIAIPVFTSQRARAQDSQTISDVRNIAVQAESFLVDKNNKFSDLSKTNIEFASSKNVSWDIKGSDSLGGYCVVAKNDSGKKYKTDVLTYDSLAGGVGKKDGACTTANTPTPSGSTADGSSPAENGVGSLVAVGSQTFLATSSGNNGTRQSYSVTSSGVYKIEAYGAQGGSSYSGGSTITGNTGAYASGYFNLASGQTLTILVGQAGSIATGAGGWSGGSFSTFAAGGGGGGSFIVNGSTPLVIAGGGASGNGANRTPLPVSTDNVTLTTARGYNAGFLSPDGIVYNSGSETPARGWANGSNGAGSTSVGNGGAGGYGGGGVGTGSGYGAGGGANASGGAGSSHVNSTSIETSITASTQTGNGKVVITRLQ